MTDDERWRAIEARDSRLDGAFVYAVRSTGVFCRPGCASRRPRRDRVVFFDGAQKAIDAGFRPCRRCRPDAVRAPQPAADLARRVCRLIAARDDGIPTLAGLAAEIGVSPHHLQRTFKRVIGVSPRAYAEALRVGRLKAEMRNGESVASALYGAGYGSSSRLYEKADGHLGMTPASYARGGRGASIAFATAACALGRLLVAMTERGLCAVSLGEADAELEAELRRDFREASLRRDDGRLAEALAAVVEHLDGARPTLDLPLDVRATAFQWQVYQRLRAIPRGETRTYGAIAADLGRPGAARAVGRACATNPVSVVIPCHRAIGADGRLTGYRWGTGRKRKILERERGAAGEVRRT